MKTWRKRLAVGVLVVLCALAPASAIHPKQYGHLGITTTALGEITAVVQGQTLRFSGRAIGQIVEANKHTDHLALQKFPWLHFDSEDFLGSTTSLVSTKDAIIRNISGASPDGERARKDLGKALHIIQDYYSHSNWINLTTYPGTIDTRLGIQAWDKGNAGPPPTATNVVPTCTADNNNLVGTGFTWLTTGYFDHIGWCYGGPQGKDKCRHGGIPVLCPGGISKDEPGREGYDLAHFLAIQASPAGTCW